jgi:zinc transport system substrate-binding protein
MKALRRLLAAAVTGGALCGSAGAALAKLDVVVTIKPIHSLVTQLMDGVGTPRLLVDGAASPHSFALKPSGVRAVQNADVFVRVSESLEPFTAKIVSGLPKSVDVVTLEDAPSLRLLDRRTSGTFGAHRHGSDDSSGNGKDGHIWLDPDNAKAIVAYLAKALGTRSPADAARINANAAKLTARINALTADIESETRPLRGMPFVVFHDAFQYFETRFGLDAVGSITVSPQVQPSAKRLRELRETIRSLSAVCVFAEPTVQPNLLIAVTEGTDARSGTLDAEGLTLAPGAELYFELMSNLASELKACLERTRVGKK